MDTNAVDFIIQSGFISGVIAVLFFAFSLTDRSFSKRIRRLFHLAAVMLLVLVVSDATNVYVNLQSEPSALSYITDSIGYILRPVVIMVLCFILQERSRRCVMLVHIPALLNTLAVLANIPFQGIVFSYSAENVFVRGPLGWAPFAAAAVYLLLFVVWAVMKYIKIRSDEIFMAAFFVVAMVVALVLEVAYKYEFMVVGIIGLGLIFYYLYLHIQVYSRDSLTSVYNRRNFFLDAEELRHTKFVLVTLDINDLKDINDKYGHAEGDKALCSMVDAMRKSMRHGCTMYRVGGDEFDVICRSTTVSEAEEMMKTFETHMSKTSYGAAYGISVFEPGMDIENVCAAADSDMYLRKNSMKHID